jgi:DNA-binding winged helix-turn-helix (wHTH) protein
VTAQIFVESPLSQPVASVGAASSVQHHEADMLNGPVMRFGPFVVVPGRRQLLRNGKPVDLGSRAFDLLLILLKSRGSVVTKQDIIKHVWPSTVVDDTNLRFQMASLRKALGKDHDVIKTIPGRGYLFTIDATSAFGVSEEFLPADQEAGRQASLQPVPSASARYHGSNLDASEPPDTSQVVIIDDDDDIREALEGLLRSAGMLVKHSRPCRPLWTTLDRCVLGASCSMSGCRGEAGWSCKPNWFGTVYTLRSSSSAAMPMSIPR